MPLPVSSTIPGTSPNTVPGAPFSVPGAPRTVPGFQAGNIGASILRDRSGRFRQGGYGVAWAGVDVMEQNFDKFGKGLINARREALVQLEPEVLAWAQQHAPWQDRTKAARSRLKTLIVDDEVNGITSLYLGHGVDYGIWLEVRFGGKYAIVIPTLAHFSPLVMGQVRKVSFF